MEEYEDCILRQLPPRVRSAPSPTDFATTQVEQYVRDVVETVDALPHDAPVVEEIMAALYQQCVPPPIALSTAALLLKSIFNTAKIAHLFKEYAPFMPRLLKTLNGRQYSVVHPSILAEAARREMIVSCSSQGWGVCEPPPHATAYRLLVSSGLPAELLPPYKTLPPAMRARMTAAWSRTCDAHGWDPCHPVKDLRQPLG